MSANEPERNALADELADLHRRLGEGIFYTEYDEDSRLMGVLRRHIDALRAGEAGKPNEAPASVERRVYTRPLYAGEVERRGRRKITDRRHQPASAQGTEHPGDGPHAYIQEPHRPGVFADQCSICGGYSHDPIHDQPASATVNEAHAMADKLAAITAERAPGAEQPYCWELKFAGDSFKPKVFPTEAEARFAGSGYTMHEWDVRPLYAAPQPDLAGK